MWAGISVFVLVLGICRADYLSWSYEEEDSSEWGVVKGNRSPNCSCGWTNMPGKRIIGGTETGINQYPLVVALQYKKSKAEFCGGSIITSWHVLTAAHCTTPVKQAGKTISVVVGEHNLIYTTETTATKTIDVAYSIEHERYGLLGHPNDIALLVLVEPIEFNKFVGPACLPTKVTDMTGEYVKILGWGRTTAQGSGSVYLQKVNLRIIPKDECNAKLPVKLPKENRQFCTHAQGKDSCKGDSGGPVLWRDPETNRYVLQGLVSFGISCGTDTPGVNTNVAYYLDWIQAKIAESKPEAQTCA